MRHAAAVAVLTLTLVPRGDPFAAPAASRVEAAAGDITPATVDAVERWVKAVKNHTPGLRDTEVEMVSALTFDQRKEMDSGMEFFLTFLRRKPVSIRNPAEKRLAEIAGDTRQVPGPEAFLKRAAVLHADTAFMRHVEGVTLAEPVPLRQSSSSPLLSQGSLFINRDGEILGETAMEWNWVFARSLMDLVLASQPDNQFAATWYHTTAAFMFQRGLYGEAVAHLQRAAAVLPDDPRILFDRACYAEILGMPRHQVLLSDQDVSAALRARASNGEIKIRQGAAGTLAIPLAHDTNEQAERLFRRALRADPTFGEARVRLGRLLGVRKRHDEAAAELATALSANPTGVVLFYARLFAGRSAQALGKIPDAVGHYKAAGLLFPGAQSAGLAQSQAALLEADVPAALESIQRVDKSSTARDPWRVYQLGAGRNAEALMREMWRQVVKF
jgi:tetratricopeptide (TPR) repeat protein